MPEPGDIRRGATESVQWDGTRWTPLPAQSSWVDSVPGLRDIASLPSNLVEGAKAVPDVLRGLVHEPGATIKGFAQGASEAATPDRVGLLSLLTAGATVPAALAAAGGEALAQGARVATDAKNQPQSFPEAAGNVAEAVSIPAVAGALQAVPGAVERMGGSKNVATRTLGAGFGGYEGYRYGGIPGAVLGAVAGFKAPDLVGSKTLRALRSVTGGSVPDAVADDVAASSAPEFASAPVARPDSVLSNVTLSPDALARNVEAKNLRDVSGFSHSVAGRLADIPVAGRMSVKDVPMGQWNITDEMIQNIKNGDYPDVLSLRGLSKASSPKVTPDIPPGMESEADSFERGLPSVDHVDDMLALLPDSWKKFAR